MVEQIFCDISLPVPTNVIHNLGGRGLGTIQPHCNNSSNYVFPCLLRLKNTEILSSVHVCRYLLEMFVHCILGVH